MKRFLAIAILTAGVSVSALAGDVPSVDVNLFPPEGAQVTNNSSSGDIPSVPSDRSADEIEMGLIDLVLGVLLV